MKKGAVAGAELLPETGRGGTHAANAAHLPPREHRPGAPEAMSTRRQALSLYRDCLRAARRFHWTNDKGEPWNEILKKNARREFEEARFETDPLLVTRMLVTGRDALQKIEEKFMAAEKKIFEKIASSKSRR